MNMSECRPLSPVPSQEAYATYNKLSAKEKDAIVMVTEHKKKKKEVKKRKRTTADTESDQQEADVADGVFFTFDVLSLFVGN